MATNKRVFTLRLSDEVFDKIGIYVLMQHLEQIEREHGEIETGQTE